MELDVLLQLVGFLDITRSLGLGMLLNGSVVTIDVGLVVLTVVQLIDLARNVWLQCSKVPFQFWQADLGSEATDGHFSNAGVLGNSQCGSHWDSGERHGASLDQLYCLVDFAV
ncbi:hypothetical protein OGATHE_006704 [Ogataea polymorpha]|uniref:Uncharacterized protein n=1 Tax=Ogataea polymorpha TaxID=460523 RepID=A0A9P8NS36_9ASCO|nr:hypothetical protein OGATHE_006704 [Ogataea polymorpha]